MLVYALKTKTHGITLLIRPELCTACIDMTLPRLAEVS